MVSNKVHQKLQSILRRSTLISNAGEKQRNQFFNRLYAKLPLREFDNETLEF
jgi:hypothetical protein